MFGGSELQLLKKSGRLTSEMKRMSLFFFIVVISAVLLVVGEKRNKKDCAISQPTDFILVHCRLVSQCNAPQLPPTPSPPQPILPAPLPTQPTLSDVSCR